MKDYRDEPKEKRFEDYRQKFEDARRRREKEDRKREEERLKEKLLEKKPSFWKRLFYTFFFWLPWLVEKKEEKKPDYEKIAESDAE